MRWADEHLSDDTGESLFCPTATYIAQRGKNNINQAVGSVRASRFGFNDLATSLLGLAGKR